MIRRNVNSKDLGIFVAVQWVQAQRGWDWNFLKIADCGLSGVLYIRRKALKIFVELGVPRDCFYLRNAS
jgi:hypothetical protein